MPKLTAVDPKERAKRRRRRCLTWLCILLILGLVFGILWYKNKLGCIGLARFEEPVAEACCPAECCENGCEEGCTEGCEMECNKPEVPEEEAAELVEEPATEAPADDIAA